MEEDQIGSLGYYIQHIFPEMFHIDYFEDRDGVNTDEFKLDMEFLKLFLQLCLERWDFTSDEQSRERLRSMMTAFEVIWPIEEHNGGRRTFLDRLKNPQEGEMRKDLIFELGGRIHQTKLLIKGWCVSLLLPSLMQCKCKPTSTIDCDVVDEFVYQFLDPLVDNLGVLLRRRDAFDNYIGILIDMIDFLQKLFNNLPYSTESKNCIEFLHIFNFACAFSNKAACFTCLYWANVDETATEMNIVLLAMIHEFLPCAPDVIACYFRILRSSEYLQSILLQETPTEKPQSIVLEETVESFVDFFFGHLEVILKDEFPILRDQLIYLFTFIIDHPSLKAEEDLIRNQIYALFREDVYLLVSFNETKEDFSNNNILLRDFINKVEIANANIRQRYYAFSYSWIGSEAVKMDYLYFVPVKKALIKHIKLWLSWFQPVPNQLRLCVMELEFLRASLLWFAMLDDGDEEIMSRLNLVIISLQGVWGKEEEKGFLADRLHEILNDEKGNIAHWHLLAFELEGKIELSKLEISTQLVNGFHWSLPSKPSTSNKILKFLDSIIYNLNALVSNRGNKLVLFKKQIETLENKLSFMQNIMKLVENCRDTTDLGEFIMFVQVFANEAACLTILYWVKKVNDKAATEINLILSHILHKIKPSTPCVARLYFETLKAIYLQRSDPLLFGQTASIFVDFLLEDSVTLFKDDFQILQDDVIFLLTFLNDPPNRNAEELICSQIDNTFWEDVYGILPIDDMKRDFSHKMVRLSGFMMKIKTVNAKIRKLYCEFPDSSLYDLPKITSPWYLDFLIQNLRNLIERMITDHKFVLCVKYKIVKLEEELVSLSPFFNYIFELQNELNATWLQVVDLLHLTEHVINLCIRSWFVFDHPIWYYMAYISDVYDRIKVIKTKLEKIKETNMHNVCYLPHSAGVIDTCLKQEWSSEIDEVVVGFDDMARKLIDDLKGEHKSLDVVSIVGMGGLGKTTLARKVSSSVKDNFDILAFYTVSQDHNTRMLLLGILKHIIKVDDKISRMTNDDLAHKLWKCLSRQKYLIVLDDVWHTSVWNEVKRSLPDNKNGSRVMFTTRFYNVANECKMKSSPFEMPFISDVESWELLQKKVFQNGISPSNLSNIGRRIAKSCKGLPLAIVVIAGVLARKERSEGSWSEIAEKVFSFLSDEGCMKILEFSYNHLPEYLKPCILYLGAFPEDKLFRVNQVTRLWIAEGFVYEYETKSVEDVAKEYFLDLVDRSLMIVSSRGSDGEIKTFNVHDLIHKLCQTKCHEGNFFKLGRGIAASSSMYSHYRISDLAVPLNISGGSSSLENASTLLLFTDTSLQDSSFKKLKLVQVLYLESKSERSLSMSFPTLLVNLRHIEFHFNYFSSYAWLPSSISNLWNIQSLILTSHGYSYYLPETFWKMKSLRHVKVRGCMLMFSDGHGHEHEHEQLDKVISFSSPVLFSVKELEQLLQRLPVVRKLGIRLKRSYDNIVDTLDFDNVDTLAFFRKLETLNIYTNHQLPYLINFPSTLKKLTLERLHLPLTCISSIAELKYLRVLKLWRNSFMEPTLDMEDVVFNHLVFFELYDIDLEQWNASAESFPCLEQLLIRCHKLEELPPCFGEISTLKRIAILTYSTGLGASALRIQEELMDLGNKVEFTLNNKKVI